MYAFIPIGLIAFGYIAVAVCGWWKHRKRETRDVS